ncbi:MAG: hypothetical protein AB8E15_08655 [Bdellovibrionales bacterium]
MDHWSNMKIAADNGWKISLKFTSGESFPDALITHIDEENKAIVCERVGERHLKPKLIYLDDVADTQLHW